MPEFLRLSHTNEALQTLLRALPEGNPSAETIETADALDRILAEDVRAPNPLPEFTRSTVDGYAVRARDTFGVSELLPGYLTLSGEVPMGTHPGFAVTPGSCALIHTGGMLPDGADAVVMIENTQMISGEVPHGRSQGGAGTTADEHTDPVPAPKIEIGRAVAEGENVLRIGEDVAADQVVLKTGKLVRPAEIGGCMALGILQLRVAIKPIIGIISSGDEVISPNECPRMGQVRDVNSYSLAALIKKAGGKPKTYGIVPDNLEMMKAVALRAINECAAVIITAGSSASSRDMTDEAISSLGLPGVLVHGVNVRPGKPTILAVCNGKAVIGLPGNPVSALVIAGLFVVPMIEKLLGLNIPHPHPYIMARLTMNVPSQAGREDWITVKLIDNEKWDKRNKDKTCFLAEPIFGKSNLIFSLSAADGLVRIPPDATGVSAGEIVEVVLI